MTAKQGLNIELGARRVAGAAKAPEKAAGDADGSHFVIRAYIYFIVRVKRALWKTRACVWLFAHCGVFEQLRALRKKQIPRPSGLGMTATRRGSFPARVALDDPGACSCPVRRAVRCGATEA